MGHSPALLLRIRLTLAAALLLVPAGCAGPRYRRPEIAVPQVHRGEEKAPATSSSEPQSLGELRWRDLIQDEQLSRLIQEALGRNLDVQIAAARVLEARAQLSASRSARLPSVNGLSGYSNSRDSQFASSFTSLSAALAWELDLWGRIRNSSAAARAALLAGEQARRTVLQTLVSDLASSYFLLRDLDLEAEITIRTLKMRKESLELVQLRVENGYSSEIELRQAEVLVKSARTALTGLELQREQTENQIAVLLGRNPGPVERGRSLLDQGLSRRLPAGLPSGLLNRRPDILQAEQQLMGDHALVAVARTAYFPAISLTSSTGFASSALLNLFKAASGSWTFAPSASLPVFNAGAVAAGVHAAQARRQESLLVYRKTVQQAFREVADALAGCRKLAELRTQQEGLVESLRQGTQLADLAYTGGVASYLEFLDSERQLLDAQLLLVQIRRQELTSILTLYRALGGGWQ